MTDDERRQKVVDDYKAAYEHANGYVPKGVRYYGNGWFIPPLSTRKVRERELVAMTETLRARPHHSEKRVL